jgi:hypothetical protein
VKKIDHGAEYVKDPNQGFETFARCFADVYEHEDLEVLRLFAPIAEALIDKEIPPMKGIPDERNEIDEDFKNNRTDISFEETLSICSDVTEKIAPNLKKKLGELLSEKKLFTNLTYADNPYEKENLERLKDLIKGKREELLQAGDSDKSCEIKKELMRLEGFLAMHEERDKLMRRVRQGSKYNRNYDMLNIRQDYTIQDSTTLIHELGHADTSAISKRLSEIPSITAEMVADDYLGKNGVGNGRVVPQRLFSIQENAKRLLSLVKMLETYENIGVVSHKEVEEVRMGRVGAESLASEKYNYDNVYNIIDVFNGSANYFIGGCSALVLLDKIRSAEDMQHVFDLLNEKGLNDIEKLQQLGITKESIATAINTAIHNNAAKLPAEKERMTKWAEAARNEVESLKAALLKVEKRNEMTK